MAAKYGKAHGEKVAFSESYHQSALLEVFYYFWFSCTDPDRVARACLDGDDVSVLTTRRAGEDMLERIVSHDRRPTLMMF
jgi:hypothetical protein